MASDDPVDAAPGEPTAAARRSVRRALERSDEPAVRRELREALQLLYAVEE